MGFNQSREEKNLEITIDESHIRRSPEHSTKIKTTMGLICYQASQYQVLTKEQEYELLKQVQDAALDLQAKEKKPDHIPDSQIQEQGKWAKDRLIKCNLRLVISIVKKKYSRNCTEPMEDLIQSGCIGLSKATERFDLSTGHKFSTFAYWWIRQTISRDIENTSRIVRLPVNGWEKTRKIKSFVSQFTQTHGRSPTLNEIATGLNLKPDYILDLLKSIQPVKTLDRPSAKIDHGETLKDLIPNNPDVGHGLQSSSLPLAEDLERQESESNIAETLRGFVDQLPEDQQLILVNREGLFGYPAQTIEEISQQIDLPKSEIRRLLRQAKSGLRKLIQGSTTKAIA